MRCQHDLPVTSLEALLHAHSLIRFLVDLFSEAFLVLATVDVHPRRAARFYGVVQRTSPFEAEALGDDPGLPSLDLGRARAVGASCGEEEEEGAHAAGGPTCCGVVAAWLRLPDGVIDTFECALARASVRTRRWSMEQFLQGQRAGFLSIMILRALGPSRTPVVAFESRPRRVRLVA